MNNKKQLIKYLQEYVIKEEKENPEEMKSKRHTSIKSVNDFLYWAMDMAYDMESAFHVVFNGLRIRVNDDILYENHTPHVLNSYTLSNLHKIKSSPQYMPVQVYENHTFTHTPELNTKY